MVKKNFLLFLFTLSMKAYSGFYFQHSFNMENATENNESLDYSTMRNIAFLGAGFGKMGKWILGWNYIGSSKELNNSYMSNKSSIALTELGPRVQIYLNDKKNIYISGVYNFYVTGERDVAGETQEVTGTSMLATLGIQLKVTKKWFFGISYNYHSISIDTSTVNTIQSDVSNSYTYTFPAVEFSIRFK